MIRRTSGSTLPALVVFLLLAGAGTLAAQERPIIMIDPGHGGAEAGVIDGELVEKDLALRIAFATASEFIKSGFDVRLTRSGDYAVPSAERRRMAEDVGAALLLMIHLNRDESRTRHGAEIYAHFDNPASARAVRALAEALEAWGSEVVIEPRTGAFLQSETVPTAMIELAFMTHPVERRMIQSEAFHREMGEVLVSAARRFLEDGGR